MPGGVKVRSEGPFYLGGEGNSRYEGNFLREASRGGVATLGGKELEN